MEKERVDWAKEAMGGSPGARRYRSGTVWWSSLLVLMATCALVSRSEMARRWANQVVVPTLAFRQNNRLCLDEYMNLFGSCWNLARLPHLWHASSTLLLLLSCSTSRPPCSPFWPS